MQHPAVIPGSSTLTLQPQHRQTVAVEHLQNPPGEGSCHFEDDHTLFMFLASRPIHYLQAQDGKTHTGLFRQGDITITPADTPFFARWEGEEQVVQIRLAKAFVQRVAVETLEHDGDRLTLRSAFQIQNPELGAIATLLFQELQSDHGAGQLYLDSLANVLAVNLLRHHATTQPRLPDYDGGLPPRQLNRVLDYVDAYLHQDIKLADLAGLLRMSPFHFSRLFKQSIGLSPHQYLLQQRVERARHLLKHTDQPILDIALDCGFSSHSHLSQQFRRVTGMTPKAYRASN